MLEPKFCQTIQTTIIFTLSIYSPHGKWRHLNLFTSWQIFTFEFIHPMANIHLEFVHSMANTHLWIYSPLGKYSPLNVFNPWQIYTFEFIHPSANIHLKICLLHGKYSPLNLFPPWQIFTFEFIHPLADIHLWIYSILGKYLPLNLFTSWQIFTSEFIHPLAGIHIWIYSPLGKYTPLQLVFKTHQNILKPSENCSTTLTKLTGAKNTHDNSSHGKDIFKWFRKQFHNVLLHPIQSTKQSSFTKGLNGLHWRASSE